MDEKMTYEELLESYEYRGKLLTQRDETNKVLYEQKERLQQRITTINNICKLIRINSIHTEDGTELKNVYGEALAGIAHECEEVLGA